MAEDAYWNALEETIESAGGELDWSDTPDNDREKAEIGAAVLMLAAPELLAALEKCAAMLAKSAVNCVAVSWAGP